LQAAEKRMLRAGFEARRRAQPLVAVFPSPRNHAAALVIQRVQRGASDMSVPLITIRTKCSACHSLTVLSIPSSFGTIDKPKPSGW
jgi:hypothetical protein